MDAILKASLPKLREKLLEALQAVLPIAAIVLVLCFTIAPVSPSILLCFLLGAAMIVVGIMFFTLGAEMGMTPMGERVGAVITRSRKLPLILVLGFLLGFLITISEPDLQVLADQVPSIPSGTLILSVAAGVGLFLVFAFLRMLIGVALPKLLVLFYGLIFLLAAFVPKEFLAVAFDSGGVTTGPMTVPFIMALGVGVASIRSDENAAQDSFGLVALCSVGPILAVMVLALIYPGAGVYTPVEIPSVTDSRALWHLFQVELPAYLSEVAVCLAPIALFFAVFQAVSLKLKKKKVLKIVIGILYTYVGLVLFLTGANVGFMPAASYLSRQIAGLSFNWILIPIGMLMGWFIVQAEPAVHVLNKQVEEITSGAIPGKAMSTSLSIGVAVSIGLAMMRVMTGISIFWLVVPGYLAAIVMGFVLPTTGVTAEGVEFTDFDSFKRYMRKPVKPTYDSGGGFATETAVAESPLYYENDTPIYRSQTEGATIEDDNGNVLCNFIWRNRSVVFWRTGPKADGYLPVTVYTQEAMSLARQKAKHIDMVFYGVYAVEVVAAAAYYLRKREK